MYIYIYICMYVCMSPADVKGRDGDDRRDDGLRVRLDAGRRLSVGGVRRCVYWERTDEPGLRVYVYHAYVCVCNYVCVCVLGAHRRAWFVCVYISCKCMYVYVIIYVCVY